MAETKGEGERSDKQEEGLHSGAASLHLIGRLSSLNKCFTHSMRTHIHTHCHVCVFCFDVSIISFRSELRASYLYKSGEALRVQMNTESLKQRWNQIIHKNTITDGAIVHWYYQQHILKYLCIIKPKKKYSEVFQRKPYAVKVLIYCMHGIFSWYYHFSGNTLQ